jgi:anaerobic dimethyl sulfoxide reductase subunit B (iron-sulfur subunit)
MTQWGFYFDQTRCVGCKACMLACKSWNDERRGDYNINEDPMHEGLDWLASGQYGVPVGSSDKKSFYLNDAGETNYEQNRKYYMKEEWRRVGIFEYTSPLAVNCTSISCNHCEKPACITACPMGIIFKESEFGIVLVDNTNCISCGKCKDACPWSAPQFYDPNFRSYAQDDPKRPKMTKCTLCIDRIKEGLKPACVAACLNRALYAGPMNDLPEIASKLDKVLTPANGMPTSEVPSDYVASQGVNTKPNIVFIKK